MQPRHVTSAVAAARMWGALRRPRLLLAGSRDTRSVLSRSVLAIRGWAQWAHPRSCWISSHRLRPVSVPFRHSRGISVAWLSEEYLGSLSPSVYRVRMFHVRARRDFFHRFCTTSDRIRRTTAQLPLFLQQRDNSLKGWWRLLIPFWWMAFILC